MLQQNSVERLINQESIIVLTQACRWNGFLKFLQSFAYFFRALLIVSIICGLTQWFRRSWVRYEQIQELYLILRQFCIYFL